MDFDELPPENTYFDVDWRALCFCLPFSCPMFSTWLQPPRLNLDLYFPTQRNAGGTDVPLYMASGQAQKLWFK